MAAKCSKKSYCNAMQRHAEPGAMKGLPAGIRIAQFFDLRTGAQTRVEVIFKKTRTDRGIILNFCPWCGVKITSADID